MAGFGNKVKLTMLKGMEAVGQRASNMASSAQQKLQELNLETQRREILSEFPLRAYDLWQKGEQLPEPLSKMMESLSDLDERLGVLRAQRYAKVEGAEGENGTAETDEAAESAEGQEPAAIDAPEGEEGAATEAPQPDEAEGPEAEPAQPEGPQTEPTEGVLGNGPSAAGENVDEKPMDETETGDNA